jgi:UDP-N-acetylglucosamine 2-epimerase
MHAVTIVGARPQFVKSSVVSRLLRDDPETKETLVHTGQHYDRTMSDVFFDELELPEYDVNLAVGSGSHGRQTARMIEGIEQVLVDKKPDGVLLYGDTNSTLAGALAASKLGFPIAHVEAGLRSFDRRMPEEINRVVTDHLSALLFCPTERSVANLEHEGIREGVHRVGDVMFDVLQRLRPRIAERITALTTLGLKPKEYVVATLHRAENTDEPSRLETLIRGLEELSLLTVVVFPLHPRTRKAWTKEVGKPLPGGLLFIEPVPYLTMLALMQEATAVVTDSGGLQKESAWLGTPCITLREVTEWVETVETGWNVLVGTDPDRLLAAWEELPRAESLPNLDSMYGRGQAARKVINILKGAWHK